MITLKNLHSIGLTSALVLSLGMGLSGCNALHTSIAKSELDVQTRMSDSIFVEPTSPARRIVFVSIRNTTDKDLQLEPPVIAALQARGYTITNDPDKANYMIQANVLQCGKSDGRNADDAIGAGFGGALVGGALGGIASSSRRDALAGALIGAAAGVVGDAMVEDTRYTMVTDIQIRERPQTGEKVAQSQRTAADQGSSSSLNQSVSGGQPAWKTYRTRIVSTANKANLEFEEARQPLQEGLIRSISGML